MVTLKASFQKTVALLLMLTMVLSVIPCVASAAEGNTDNTVIDFVEKKGSITVTKYATVQIANDTESTPAKKGSATGTNSDAVTDANYKPLNGAKFVLFKIADAQKVKEYYNGMNDTSYTLDAGRFVYTNEKKATYDGVPATPVETKTTAGTGTCKFENLEVGIYVLKEITAPDQITTPLAEDSLISIPMVNTATSANNGNAEWMYDIFVYPKNHASTGTVELTKVDQNGVVENVVFELHKKEFDKDGNLPAGDWKPVLSTFPDAGVTNNSLTLTTDTEGKIKLDNLPSGLHGTQYKLQEVYVAPSANDPGSPEGYIINTKPLYFQVLPDNSIRWNDVEGTTLSTDVLKNENIGVTSASVSGTTLSITLKNERPSLTKEVNTNGYGQTEFDTNAQYRMDETITYKLTVYVPANVAELKKFIIVDTPDEGINDVASSVQVSYTQGDQTTSLNSNDFTAQKTEVANKGLGFELSFDDSIKDDIAGKTITVTYTAKLTDKAVIAGDGNENTATLTYSKYANAPDSNEVYTITDHARVYTYEYKITKELKDAGAADSPAGVEFQLLDGDKSTLVDVVSLKQDASGNDLGGKYRLALVGETGIKTMKTGTDGTLTIRGMKSQDYYLKETKTIKGYNLLSEPFKITVDVQETTSWTNGTGFTATGKTIKTYESTNYNVTDTTGTSTIINKKGFVLPQTGSMGYLLFCTVGIVLIGGGAALIFGGRKKKIR